MQRAIAIVNGAAASIRLELNHTGSVDADSDADEVNIGLSSPLSENISTGILDSTRLWRPSEVSFAVESELTVPTIPLNGKLAATAGVEARAVAVGVPLIVDGFAVVADDCKARVMARLAPT